MANELVAQLPPRAWIRETASGYQFSDVAAPTGDLVGLRLNKLDTDGYNTVFQVPASLTVGTGVTFTLLVTDGGGTPDDLGKVVHLGITVKKLASGETTDLDTGAGTEQTVDVTLQSTTQEVTLATKAIANANLDSVGAGDIAAVRIRRIGSNAADTANGSVILVGVFVKNT